MKKITGKQLCELSNKVKRAHQAECGHCGLVDETISWKNSNACRKTHIAAVANALNQFFTTNA